MRDLGEDSEAVGASSTGGVQKLQSQYKSEPRPEPPAELEQSASIPHLLRIKSELLSAEDSNFSSSSIPQTLRIKSETLSAEDSDLPLASIPNTLQKADPKLLSTTLKFNLQDAIAKLMESDSTASHIEIEPAKALNNLITLKKSVTIAAVRSKGGRALHPEHWRDVKLFLYTLSNVLTTTPAIVTPKFSKSLTLKPVLELFTNPEMKFPQDYADISQGLINQIQSRSAFESPPLSPASKLNTQPIHANIRKKTSPDSETPDSAKRSKGVSASGRSEPPRVPPPNHPIWGDNGIMRGFYLDGNTPRLNPDTNDTFKKDFRHYGHNGLTVGECWPIQLAALRDGAHGASQGGISGHKDNGAYSILISSYYEGFDRDFGNTIYYSAPGAKDFTSEEPDDKSSRVLSMKRSITTRKPVRVLRNASCAWDKRPNMGIRYDGLYRVVECKTQTNGKGGKFLRFTLKRLINQDPIKVSSPGRGLTRQFEKVKDGY